MRGSGRDVPSVRLAAALSPCRACRSSQRAVSSQAGGGRSACVRPAPLSRRPSQGLLGVPSFCTARAVFVSLKANSPSSPGRVVGAVVAVGLPGILNSGVRFGLTLSRLTLSVAPCRCALCTAKMKTKCSAEVTLPSGHRRCSGQCHRRSLREEERFPLT